MSRALPVLSLCVAIFALAFALVPREAPPPPPSGVSEALVASLQLRVERLELENVQLWERLADFERGGPVRAPSSGTPPVVAGAPVAAAPTVPLEPQTDEERREALKDAVRAVEDERRRERQAQRVAEFTERSQRDRTRWRDFATAARLTWEQEQELYRRLDAEDAARKAIVERRGDANFSPRSAVRELLGTRQETDKAMAGLLDENQRNQFKALRDEERREERRSMRPSSEAN